VLLCPRFSFGCAQLDGTLNSVLPCVSPTFRPVCPTGTH